LAAGDHRAVEHVQDRAAQRLRPVEHHQDRASHVQASLPQPDDQVGDQGGVLRRALDQRQRVLGPVDADPERDHAGVLPKCTPSIRSATRSSPDRSTASNSARAVSVLATNRRDTAEREVLVAAVSVRAPTGPSPTR
jgi:hypothetical protein